MKRLTCAILALAWLGAGAEARSDDHRHAITIRSSGAATPTPEMWFYEQERARWSNPEEIVHHNAKTRTAERRRRIAARRWHGFSNLRPTVDHTPFVGVYSPRWTSNSYHPFQWIGVGYPAVVYRPGWIAPRH